MRMKRVKEKNKELSFHMVEKFSFEPLDYKDLMKVIGYVEI